MQRSIDWHDTPLLAATAAVAAAFPLSTILAALAAYDVGAGHSPVVAIYGAVVMAVVGAMKIVGAVCFDRARTPQARWMGAAAAVIGAVLTGLAAAWYMMRSPFGSWLDQTLGLPIGTVQAIRAGTGVLGMEILALAGPSWLIWLRRQPRIFT